ncbi:Methyltransferase domain-containing protein [Prosthecobacter debontii]|uniref:Methyltransferase domain-containing protein n=1 Tax=Prosthecobacter debontii TaxID=48467 RepID=A0A1T4YVL2_9BACT|nr:class I SAM-dependent methyltransferase [Prosthecobacter debontii]SKB05809.1 Methyltransferase domain-containing protein [Prosthecobacter debontii]
MSVLRSLARRWLFTFNTIRYRVEWPRIALAMKQTPCRGVIFDGGAGSGEFIRRCLGLGFSEAIALEYDEQNYALLQKNAGRLAQVRTMRESLLQIPLEDSSVDVVLSTQVLEHIEDHQKAACELCRILKPGGHAVITVPRPPEPFPNPEHMREGYTEEELSALFAPYGMKTLGYDWFLTQGTVDRMLACSKLPLRGRFMPVALVDAETSLTPAERRAQRPYGLLAIFRKEA